MINQKKYKNKYKYVSINGKIRQEHRVMMEKKLDRKLGYNELVHHKNKIKDDNRLKNFELKSRSEHTKDFMVQFANLPKEKERRRRLANKLRLAGKFGKSAFKYKKGKYWCNGCKKYLLKSSFGKDKTKKYKIKVYCKNCRKKGGNRYEK